MIFNFLINVRCRTASRLGTSIVCIYREFMCLHKICMRWDFAATWDRFYEWLRVVLIYVNAHVVWGLTNSGTPPLILLELHTSAGICKLPSFAPLKIIWNGDIFDYDFFAKMIFLWMEIIITKLVLNEQSGVCQYTNGVKMKNAIFHLLLKSEMFCWIRFSVFGNNKSLI